MIQRLRKRMICVIMGYSTVLVCFLLVLVCNPTLSWSQEQRYPNKPIKIVVPYEPGAIGDLAARVMTDYLTKELSVPILIENRAGASGMIGTKAALSAPPDGYTLIQATDGSIIIGPLKSPNPTYNLFKDLLPICAYGGYPLAFGVSKLSPIKTLANFVKEAKEKPGGLAVGLTVFGGENHLSFEIFRRAAGVEVKVIPHKGSGELASALLGNHIDMMVLSYVGSLPYVKSGEVRILAVTDKVPGSSLPTLVESGFSKEGIAMTSGILARVDTPKPIYEKLVSVFQKVASNPELTKKWETVGLTPDYMNPKDYTIFLKKKWETYSRIIDEMGLKGK